MRRRAVWAYWCAAHEAEEGGGEGSIQTSLVLRAGVMGRPVLPPGVLGRPKIPPRFAVTTGGGDTGAFIRKLRMP